MPSTQSLPRTATLLDQQITDGLHLGGQVYASLNGQIKADFAFGHAAPLDPNQTPAPMTTDMLLPWLSSGKVITTLAIAQLVERDKLNLDAPIASVIPPFAQHGKDRITLRHVLTHTGGFRAAPFQFPRDSWEKIIETICAVRPEPRWIPGEKAGYHPHTAWYILGEMARITSGEDFSAYVRRHVLEPIGMTDTWIGMSHDQYQAYGERIGVMMDTSKSPPVPRDDHLPEQVERPQPSANARGPIRELGWFYEMLLAGGRVVGQQIVKRQTIELFTSPQRVGLYDHTFKQTIDWGLGFILDSKKYSGGSPVPYGYGPHASPRTFGHSGSQSSTGFADPDYGLAAAIILNGMPGEEKHRLRMDAILKALYEDLELV